MINGAVNADRECIIRLSIQGPSGQEQEVEAVIDTGFNGFMTLPPDLISSLSFPRIGRGRAILANGQTELFDVYEATVVWDGQPRVVEADSADTDVLIGMSMVYGYELRVQVVDAGLLTIEAI